MVERNSFPRFPKRFPLSLNFCFFQFLLPRRKKWWQFHDARRFDSDQCKRSTKQALSLLSHSWNTIWSWNISQIRKFVQNLKPILISREELTSPILLPYHNTHQSDLFFWSWFYRQKASDFLEHAYSWLVPWGHIMCQMPAWANLKIFNFDNFYSELHMFCKLWI